MNRFESFLAQQFEDFMDYKHTAKYLKLLDAEHRHHLVNFISTQRHAP